MTDIEPLCPIYTKIVEKWREAHRAGNKADARKYAIYAREHHQDCEKCQKRMRQMTELAKNAKHPEMKVSGDERNGEK